MKRVGSGGRRREGGKREGADIEKKDVCSDARLCFESLISFTSKLN